jgi:hypothetical protein
LEHHDYLIYKTNLGSFQGRKVGIFERIAKHMTEIHRHNAHSINITISLYSSIATTNLFPP